jgi:hypothetical protein
VEREPGDDTQDDDDETLLGDADEVDHPSIEEQLDERLDDEQDGDGPA